jgi:lambda repressor-like predicted transcriptional regulator
MARKITFGMLAALLVALSISGTVAAQELPPDEGNAAPTWHRGGFRPVGGRPWLPPQGLDIVAEVLDMEPDEVRDALADGQTFEELAAAADMTLDELVDAFKELSIERIEQAAADGKLDEDRAANMIEQIEQAEGLPPFVRRRMAPFHAAVNLADALGMTPQELRDALAEGQTIAELAEEQGMSLDELVEVLVAPALERTEQAVDNGRITQERADEMVENLSDRILERLETGERPEPEPGFFCRLGRAVWNRWPEWLPKPHLPQAEAE